MSKFKIGDKVMLSPNSEWVEGDSNDAYSCNPLRTQGTITHQDFYSVRHKWEVEWCNGTVNTYGDTDLILVSDNNE